MTRKQKILLLAAIAFLATVLGRLFLNSPIANFQLAPETIGTDIFGKWNLSNAIIGAWVAMGVLVVLAVLATRKMQLVPRGLQNLVEAILEWLLDLVENVAGKANGRRFFPLLATIFLFIIVANWISLTPVFGTIGKIDTAEFHLKERLQDVVNDLNDKRLEAGKAPYELVYEPGRDPEDRDTLPVRPDNAVVSEVLRKTGSDRLHIFNGDSSPFTIPIGFNKVKEIKLREYWDFDNWQARTGVVKSGDNEVDLTGKTVGTLAPYLRNMNTALMNPLAIALVAMFFVELWGIQSSGFRSYLSRFINFKQGPIGFFVGGLEAVSEFAKLISFSFRLLGNMFAGEILIFTFVFLLPVMAGILVFPFLLEFFVGFIQAIVFMALTLVFATLAVTSHTGPGHEGEGSAPGH